METVAGGRGGGVSGCGRVGRRAETERRRRGVPVRPVIHGGPVGKLARRADGRPARPARGGRQPLGRPAPGRARPVVARPRSASPSGSNENASQRRPLVEDQGDDGPSAGHSGRGPARPAAAGAGQDDVQPVRFVRRARGIRASEMGPWAAYIQRPRGSADAREADAGLRGDVPGGIEREVAAGRGVPAARDGRRASATTTSRSSTSWASAATWPRSSATRPRRAWTNGGRRWNGRCWRRRTPPSSRRATPRRFGWASGNCSRASERPSFSLCDPPLVRYADPAGIGHGVSGAGCGAHGLSPRILRSFIPSCRPSRPPS